mmetsp:Transcript_1013/g.2921  ORF Transcript_1013/g.2921 Transcript_1013/m.2921 type:complete len:251 (-) Transcript_1013:314-1066(-)
MMASKMSERSASAVLAGLCANGASEPRACTTRRLCCSIESAPPVTSSSTTCTEKPRVERRLALLRTCGMYLKIEHTAFTSPIIVTARTALSAPSSTLASIASIPAHISATSTTTLVRRPSECACARKDCAARPTSDSSQSLPARAGRTIATSRLPLASPPPPPPLSPPLSPPPPPRLPLPASSLAAPSMAPVSPVSLSLSDAASHSAAFDAVRGCAPTSAPRGDARGGAAVLREACSKVASDAAAAPPWL